MSTAPTLQPRRRPSRFLMAVRVVVLTVAFTLLGFAFGGLLGIVCVAILRAMGNNLDMYMAIGGAVPGAGIGAVVGFVIALVSERRHAQSFGTP